MRCSLCQKEQASFKKTIGKTVHLFCPNCQKVYKESVNAVKDMVNENPEIDDLIAEEIKQTKDREYAAIIQAILNRNNYKQDLEDLLKAIKGENQ